jgi:hypothetical protein
MKAVKTASAYENGYFEVLEKLGAYEQGYYATLQKLGADTWRGMKMLPMEQVREKAHASGEVTGLNLPKSKKPKRSLYGPHRISGH